MIGSFNFAAGGANIWTSFVANAGFSEIVSAAALSEGRWLVVGLGLSYAV